MLEQVREVSLDFPSFTGGLNPPLPPETSLVLHSPRAVPVLDPVEMFEICMCSALLMRTDREHMVRF